MGRKRNKLQRYHDIAQVENVLEYTEDNATSVKGNWATRFENDYPITLELACGKGEYSLALADRFPERNYIGIDLKGARLWKGATAATERGLDNLQFLRIYIDHITEYFAPGEVDEIWITFCDPHPTKGGAKKRLTHPRFLERYKQILKPGGIINVKIDDDMLYEFTLKTIPGMGATIITQIDDVYGSGEEIPLLTDIQTYYEQKHLAAGKTIHYVAFTL